MGTVTGLYCSVDRIFVLRDSDAICFGNDGVFSVKWN